jgi:hypothetical protein
MESLPQLYEQLTKLVNTIRQCNFTSYNERQDIIHDTLEKIVIKQQEGVLSDDFNAIKGYSFMVLRNFCNAYHNKNKLYYTDELYDIEDEFINEIEEKQYTQYLHGIVNKFLLKEKYSEDDRNVCRLILDNIEDKEIRETLGFSGRTLIAIKQSIKTKLKNDAKRSSKYLIKSKFDPTFLKICYTRTQVFEFFHDYHPNYVVTLMTQGQSTRHGYYIENVTKKK